MTQLTSLLLLVAPWVAIAVGLALLVAASTLVARRLRGGQPSWRGLASAASGLLLGVACLGLGATYLLTSARTGYDGVYLAWLGVAAAAGLLSVLHR